MKQKFKIIKFLLLALVPCVILFSAISYAVEPHYEVRLGPNVLVFGTLPELLREYRELQGSDNQVEISYVSEGGQRYDLITHEGSLNWVGPEGEIGENLNGESGRFAALESMNQQGEWNFLPKSALGPETLLRAHEVLDRPSVDARTIDHWVRFNREAVRMSDVFGSACVLLELLQNQGVVNPQKDFGVQNLLDLPIDQVHQIIDRVLPGEEDVLVKLSRWAQQKVDAQGKLDKVRLFVRGVKGAADGFNAVLGEREESQVRWMSGDLRQWFGAGEDFGRQLPSEFLRAVFGKNYLAQTLPPLPSLKGLRVTKAEKALRLKQLEDMKNLASLQARILAESQVTVIESLAKSFVPSMMRSGGEHLSFWHGPQPGVYYIGKPVAEIRAEHPEVFSVAAEEEMGIGPAGLRHFVAESAGAGGAGPAEDAADGAGRAAIVDHLEAGI